MSSRTGIENFARNLFGQILEAIQYMHANGLCHRDLKPHNILFLAEKWQVKITDFNVSKYFRTSLGAKNTLCKMTTHTGTMAFCAPETFTSEEYT